MPFLAPNVQRVVNLLSRSDLLSRFPENYRQLSSQRRVHSVVNIAGARKNPHAHKNKIGTSTPPSKKAQKPPLKGGILWAWGFSSRKNQKMPGAHKIGAAISGPRITGGNFVDITLFLNSGGSKTLWHRIHYPVVFLARLGPLGASSVRTGLSTQGWGTQLDQNGPLQVKWTNPKGPKILKT